jgi:hypothetical protein
VPANRSRTLEWRRCLQQVHERNGVIEIAVAREYLEGEAGHHLVWRVRILDLSDDEIVVEQPMALGQVIPLRAHLDLVAIMSVGQNRWMFETTCLGLKSFRFGNRRSITALRMAMPASVRRCQRRNYFRMETTGVSLPDVEAWPLLDPKSVVLAERCNEILFLDQDLQSGDPTAAQAFTDEDLMPEVGPPFTASLMNLGGGGVGLRVRPEDGQALVRHKLFWVRIDLPPELKTPICATAKLAHTHIDSSQHTYAGMAFDFSFNPGHQKFVVDQMCRYIAIQQRAQLQRRGFDPGEHRRSA